MSFQVSNTSFQLPTRCGPESKNYHQLPSQHVSELTIQVDSALNKQVRSGILVYWAALSMSLLSNISEIYKAREQY